MATREFRFGPRAEGSQAFLVWSRPARLRTSLRAQAEVQIADRKVPRRRPGIGRKSARTERRLSLLRDAERPGESTFQRRSARPYAAYGRRLAARENCSACPRRTAFLDCTDRNSFRIRGRFRTCLPGLANSCRLVSG